MTITEEKKIELFTKCLEYETLSNKHTFDNRDYWELSEGVFAALQILGLGREYIHWSEGKEWSDYLQKVVAYEI